MVEKLRRNNLDLAGSNDEQQRQIEACCGPQWADMVSIINWAEVRDRHDVKALGAGLGRIQRRRSASLRVSEVYALVLEATTTRYSHITTRQQKNRNTSILLAIRFAPLTWVPRLLSST